MTPPPCRCGAPRVISWRRKDGSVNVQCRNDQCPLAYRAIHLRHDGTETRVLTRGAIARRLRRERRNRARWPLRFSPRARSSARSIAKDE